MYNKLTQDREEQDTSCLPFLFLLKCYRHEGGKLLLVKAVSLLAMRKTKFQEMFYVNLKV